ncbi:MAG: hypothetical protein AB1756_01165 [Acidobacteriota bacterium]
MSARKDAKEILDRSIALIKEVSSKIQKEASRTWKISQLKLEILGLKRGRNEKLRSLAEEALSLVRESRVQESSLEMIVKEIDEIDDHIKARENEIEKIEKEYAGHSSKERARMEISREKGTKGNSSMGSKAVSSKGGEPDRSEDNEENDHYSSGE